jgi:hypothetical protein
MRSEYFLCNLYDVAVVAAMSHLSHTIAAMLQRLQQCCRDCSDIAFVACDLCNNCNIAEITCTKLDIWLGGTKWYLEYQSVLKTFICCGMENGRFATTLVGVLLTRVMPRLCYLRSRRSPLFAMILLCAQRRWGLID